MTRRGFILNNISTLEPARSIHWRKPAADMTHQSKHPSNHRRSYFAHLVWTSPETLQHLPNQFSVLPLLVFDGVDASSFFRFAHRMPVPAIGITRSQLAGIG